MLREQKNSPRQPKPLERAGALGPFRLHAVNASQSWAFLDRSLQILELSPRALGHKLDCPVVVVAYPSLEAELLRPALDEIAKADTLNMAADEEPAGNAH